MISKINKDHRGLFVELLKQKDISKYKQISYLTIEPNFFRGNHYHKKTYEAFILLEGDCEIVKHFEKEDEFYKHPTKIQLQIYEIIEVEPLQQHTLLSKKGAKLLTLASQEFNLSDPDTFIYE